MSAFRMTLLVLTLTFVSAMLQQICCYENLSQRNSTVLSQSSTYSPNVASRANDGNLQTTYNDCAHTAPNRSIAWFQVDLGSLYNLHSVKIYYRRDGNGTADWMQFRFRQFYLDVSDLPANRTTTSQRTRCYTDNTTAPNLPPNIINIPCKRTARYVIVETTYDAPEDDRFSPGVFLEICEIEVYGCSPNCLNTVCSDYGNCTHGCEVGHWGQTCESACPVNCREQCDKQYGRCSGACTQGYWGDGCNKQCSTHCKGSVCDKITGRCTEGCDVGWYGDTCIDTCSPGCAAGSCDQQSGACSAGCVQNWTGDRCDRCDVTHYGPDCSRECSVNCIQKSCNNITGSCTQGCKIGFYGDFCNNVCGSCLAGCKRQTGECEGACPVGKFGTQCDKTCNQNCQNECDKNTGVCMTCIDGMFGESCNQTWMCGCDRYTGGCECTPAQQLSGPTTNTQPVLYGVAAVLCFSLCLNIFSFTWIFRKEMFKRNNGKQPSLNEIAVPTVVYDSVEDNTGYEELGQLSEPSHYDEIHKEK